MALHANIPACTYWNGYLYYSTSALRHFSSQKDVPDLCPRYFDEILQVL